MMLKKTKSVSLQSLSLSSEGLTRASSVVDFPRSLPGTWHIAREKFSLGMDSMWRHWKTRKTSFQCLLLGKILQDAADAADCQHFGLLFGGKAKSICFRYIISYYAANGHG